MTQSIDKQSLFETCDVICIAGATASGKSDFALKLAHQMNGVVINADSCQIYQELSILTARPTISDMQNIPHYLYGFLSLCNPYNVQKWCFDAKNAIQDTLALGKRPILVGGTGLYFHGLLNGLAHIPDISDDIRHDVRQMPNDKIYDMLGIYDPISHQKLHLNDTQRLQRALEVVLSTKYPMEYWHKNTQKFLPDTLKIGTFMLMPQRDWLYDRINRRFDMMMRQGALHEAEYIIKNKLDTHSNARNIVGLSELIDYLNGHISLNDAVESAKQSSRNYAKRQMTWFRNKGQFTPI
jgi:tRNA dimethylallyltransferase